MLKFALVNKRSSKKIKEKLDSSQEAYKTLLEQYESFANLNVELSTKIEQLKASATTNACTINDEQLVKKNERLKESYLAHKMLVKVCLLKWKPCANVVMS